MARKSKRHRRAVKRGKKFLILCEGQTERLYFKSFHAPGVSVEPRDTPKDRSSLVTDAIKLNDGSYDEVWAVFDLDHNPARGREQFDDFDRTVARAEAAGIKIAYSVDAVELWFCLHYELVTSTRGRAHYYEMLSKRWGMDYKKEGKKLRFCLGLRERLRNDAAASEEHALKHAQKLLDKWDGEPPHARNPVTRVGLLVEALLGAGRG